MIPLKGSPLESYPHVGPIEPQGAEAMPRLDPVPSFRIAYVPPMTEAEIQAQLAASASRRPAEQMPAPAPPPPRLHPATQLVKDCPDRARDLACGCSGCRCRRSGELVQWDDCLACKSGEVAAAQVEAGERSAFA